MIYTFRPEHIVRKAGEWTGHISSYFNAHFDMLRVMPLIVEFTDEKTIEIIKEIEDFHSITIFDDFKDAEDRQLSYYKSIIAKTFNTIHECIDVSGRRFALNIDEWELTEFQPNDIYLYFEKVREVNEFNVAQEQRKMEFLLSKNALQDYLDYHNGRSSMFKEISKTLSKVLKKDESQ